MSYLLSAVLGYQVLWFKLSGYTSSKWDCEGWEWPANRESLNSNIAPPLNEKESVRDNSSFEF